MSYTNLPGHNNSRFNYAAGEVLRTGVPQYNQVMIHLSVLFKV